MKVTKMKHQNMQRKMFLRFRKLDWFLKWPCGRSFIQCTSRVCPCLLVFFFSPLKKCFVIPLHVSLHYRNIYWISFRLDLIEFIKVQKCNNFFFLAMTWIFFSSNSWQEWRNTGFLTVQHLIGPLVVQFVKYSHLQI